MIETTIERGALLLVRLLVSYPAALMPSGWRTTVATSPADSDLRVFYAGQSDMSNYVVLVVRDDDPRFGNGSTSGGWVVSARDRDRLGLPEDGHRYVGWNVERTHVEEITAPTEDTPTEDATAPVSAVETFTEEQVQARIREAVREAVAEARREFETWKDRLASDANDYADEQGYCSEFDDFMEEHGLPSRRRDYAVTFTVTVEARNEGDAAEQAAERMYDLDRWGLSQEITDVSEA